MEVSWWLFCAGCFWGCGCGGWFNVTVGLVDEGHGEGD